jgi:hypothetical protein
VSIQRRCGSRSSTRARSTPPRDDHRDTSSALPLAPSHRVLEGSTKGCEIGGCDSRLNNGKGAAIRHGNIRTHRRASARSCPTSNAQTRQILKQVASQIPQLAEQLGVEIGTLRIFGPDHIILAVIESGDIDSVRNFALQSRLMQWNTVKIHATYSIEQAVAMIDEVEAIF